jgi:uncharacterized protein (DUF4415 family)
MRDEYDFSDATANPYAKLLKKQVTIRLDQSVLEYFKHLSEEVDVPYQTLINMYLKDCATSKRRLQVSWSDDSKP